VSARLPVVADRVRIHDVVLCKALDIVATLRFIAL